MDRVVEAIMDEARMFNEALAKRHREHGEHLVFKTGDVSWKIIGMMNQEEDIGWGVVCAQPETPFVYTILALQPDFPEWGYLLQHANVPETPEGSNFRASRPMNEVDVMMEWCKDEEDGAMQSNLTPENRKKIEERTYSFDSARPKVNKAWFEEPGAIVTLIGQQVTVATPEGALPFEVAHIALSVAVYAAQSKRVVVVDTDARGCVFFHVRVKEESE